MEMVSWESSQPSSMPTVFGATEEADNVVKSVKDILCLASVSLKANIALSNLKTDDVTLGCRFR